MRGLINHNETWKEQLADLNHGSAPLLDFCANQFVRNEHIVRGYECSDEQLAFSRRSIIL